MNYSLQDGLQLTVMAMGIVFLLLIIIAGIISLFRFLPQEKEQASPKKTVSPLKIMDEEEAIVAMLVSSIVSRKNSGKNVVIQRITRR